MEPYMVVTYEGWRCQVGRWVRIRGGIRIRKAGRLVYGSMPDRPGMYTGRYSYVAYGNSRYLPSSGLLISADGIAPNPEEPYRLLGFHEAHVAGPIRLVGCDAKWLDARLFYWSAKATQFAPNGDRRGTEELELSYAPK